MISYPCLIQVQTRKERSQSRMSKEPEDEERRAAWLAIRCATAAGHAQRARLLLTGNTVVTTQKITSKAQAELPEFSVLDLVSSYVLGEKKKIYKCKSFGDKLMPLQSVDSFYPDGQLIPFALIGSSSLLP